MSSFLAKSSLFSLEELTHMANSLRILSMDAVEEAGSGHPGAPLGMADVMAVLWAQHLRYQKDAQWPARDRFILSAGHACALLYATLVMLGYMEEETLKQFRQLHSQAHGHPEKGWAIEATTGPLGQGFANGVGMALSEKMAAQTFAGQEHFTYVMLGDGCLMEGLSYEAASLAGHWKLNRLIALWDHNEITIDGHTNLARSEHMRGRFEAAGWHFMDIDGHDIPSIHQALQEAKTQREKPTLIACRTHIAYGSPNKVGHHSAHGAPLGKSECQQVRLHLGAPWENQPPFHIPPFVRQLWQRALDLRQNHPQPVVPSSPQPCVDQKRPSNDNLAPLVKEVFQSSTLQDLHKTFEKGVHQSTRKSSGQILKALRQEGLPLVVGSADLSESTQVLPLSQEDIFSHEQPGGRYVAYGVREHAMAGIMNGIALAGVYKPCGSTFLTFSDYARPSIRLAAMMKLPCVFIMTHDSVALGEDGPTHQPIEHLSSFRAMPGLHLFRPADALETLAAWEWIAAHWGPCMLCLTRQNVDSVQGKREGVFKGAYLLWESDFEDPRKSDLEQKISLWATGSEVGLALKVGHLLAEKGYHVRVISAPCLTLFDQQDEAYQKGLMDSKGLKVAIEAASSWGWQKYVGQEGLIFSIDCFGASGPASQVMEHFGLTPESLFQRIQTHLG